MQIWDTAGQEAFQSITRSYYRSSAGAFIVFDLTNRKSFENCVTWLNDVQTHGNEKIVASIIGNKSDLKDRYNFSYNST